MYTLRVAFLFAVAIVGVSSHPNGAPIDVCESMMPNHGCQSQSGRPSAIVTVRNRTLAPGECTYAIIGARGHPGYFRGYMLQVRNQYNEPVGTWSATDCNSHTIDCGTGSANTLTHSNNDKKRNVTGQWTAPNCEGVYTLWGTIVIDHDIFFAARIFARITVTARSCN